MKKDITNYAKSVRTRLLNLMNESGYKYMYLLARYFNERLLYRVSVSQYKDNFLLKGGSLLYAINGLETRPTIDVDFMTHHISRNREHLETVFREILAIECKEDGVTFDLESLRSEPITIEKDYPGTRFFVTSRMDNIVHPMSIDIGFGDVVTPCPTTIEFPMLLYDIPSITIQAYSIETVIGEKFHAMIVRDVSNSRMKDFFDCFQLLTTGAVDEAVLYDAIKATFDNRKIEYNADLQLFSESFYSDAQRLQQWNVFLKKIQWNTPIDFKYVMNIITIRLQGLYNLYWTEKYIL